MAGSVLNSTAVLRLNFCAKLNICASISATSPSCKPLVTISRMDENLRHKIEEFVALKDKESEKYFAWLRNIIGMAIALMGLLISLRPEIHDNACANLIFSISISLIALGIISGAILLFVEIHWLRKEIKIKAKWINKLLEGKSDKFEVEDIPNPWYFGVTKFVCYLSFFMAIVGLAIFTYFK